MWQGKYDRLFIGGEWVEPSSTYKIALTSPTTEQPLASVPAGTQADMDRAVAAARSAFDEGPWPRMPLDERIDVLTRVNGLLAHHEDDMAELVTAEMGCPIAQSHPIQAQRPRMILDAAIEQARTYPFESDRVAASGRARVSREPVGVVAAIVAWNVPHLNAMMKLPYGLLAGCTFVVKPSPETPLDSYLLADVMQRAGMPPGVVNFVAADRAASEYLVRHPGVDKVTFTGSVGAGRRVGAICGELVRPVTLELGGKSAAVVLDDADIDSVVAALRTSSFNNTGQVCSAKTRLVVPRSKAAEITDGLVTLLGSLPVGDPMDPSTHFGPLATRNHRARVEEYVEIGLSEGAQIAYGGGRPKGLDTGWFVEPTLFTKVDPKMRIAQEEIFGPVVSIIEYDTVEEAVAIANDSDFGLNGQVYTSDPARGMNVARRIRTGAVEINASPIGLSAPQGGVKASGIGRELGPEGFDAFVAIKSIGVPLDWPEQVPSPT